jgi:hypothetical protein
LVHKVGNHGYLPGRPYRQGGDRSDQPERSACSLLLSYSHHNRSIPFFSRDILGIGGTVGEIDFPDLIARSKKVEENVLIDTMFGKIEVKPMYRRFRAILPRDVAPGTTGGQDIQDTVEHRPMVGSWSPDMRFLRREMRLNDCPEIVIDFPEGHTSRVLCKTSYNCGMTSIIHRNEREKLLH